MELDPSHVKAQHRMAIALKQLSRTQEAITAYTLADKMARQKVIQGGDNTFLKQIESELAGLKDDIEEKERKVRREAERKEAELQQQAAKKKEMEEKLRQQAQAKSPKIEYVPPRRGKMIIEEIKEEDEEDQDNRVNDVRKPEALRTSQESQATSSSSPQEQPISKELQAAALKDEGNTKFKNGRFTEAERLYTSSIASHPSAAAYANRSLCRINQKNFQGIISHSCARKRNHIIKRRSCLHVRCDYI